MASPTSSEPSDVDPFVSDSVILATVYPIILLFSIGIIVAYTLFIG